jgi:nucleoside-diphosphate-sugar epimerase
VLRPRAIVGPDDRVILPRLAQLARRRRIPLIRNGRALIELTDVRDAAEAILCAEAAIETVHGQAVNVSGGHPLSVREVAVALAASLGYAPRLTRVPLPLAWVAAVAAEFTASGGRKPEPALTRYTLATLACSQTFDMEETTRLIGFRPRHNGLATLLSAATSLKR